jgi:hypothetical protein
MTSRLGTFLLAVALCLGMSGVATAQAAGNQPSREQVLKLMSVMGVQQSVEEALHRSQTSIKDTARDTFLKNTPGTLDDAAKKKMEEILDNEPFFKFEDMVDVVIPIYQTNLSAADVQAGIEFYSSPSGKRLLEKIPDILREANESAGKIAQQKMEKYAEMLDRKLQVLQAELKLKQPASAPDGSGAKKPEEKAPEGKSPEGKSK